MRNIKAGCIWQAYNVNNEQEERILTTNANNNGFIVEQERVGYTEETSPGWRDDQCWKDCLDKDNKSTVMKTQFCYLEIGGDGLEPKFFTKEGDYSRLDGVFINSYGEDNEHLQDELGRILYGDTFTLVPPEFDDDDDYEEEEKEPVNYIVEFTKEPTKDWDHFVVCGFYL